VRLLRDGVLVGEDGVFAVPVRVGVEAVAAGGWRLVGLVEFAQRFGVGRVDGRDDGEVVLEFVEVVGRRGDGVVEGVGEGGVEGAEGELVDVVGEVEGWWRLLISIVLGWLLVQAHRCAPNAFQTPYTHALAP